MFKWLKKLFGLDKAPEVPTYKPTTSDISETTGGVGMKAPPSYEASSRDYLKYDLSDRKEKKNTSSSSSPISDARLKKDIRGIDTALAKTQLLKGVEFCWREEEYPEIDFSGMPEFGFLAQDVEKVFPSSVGQNDQGYKTVNYAPLIAVLVEALKEQQKQISVLNEKVSALH